MRQFFTLRLWLAVAAVGVLGVGALLVARETQSAPLAAVAGAAPVETHRVDLLQWVFAVVPTSPPAVVNGRLTADMSLMLDEQRTIIVTAGTPGSIDCPEAADLGRCTVAVDLLGDAVLWFALIPGPAAGTVRLPGVVELLDGGWVRLANGWEVRNATRVTRVCDADTASLTDFVTLYGATASSTFDFARQRIVRVTCPG